MTGTTGTGFDPIHPGTTIGHRHQIGLGTWESLGARPPAPGTTGPCHTAVPCPTRVSLRDALRRPTAAVVPLERARDHGAGEALSPPDPDGGGVEIDPDRPRGAWPTDAAGRLAMSTRRLDREDLLAAD